jgi:hypothetical protein
VPGSSYFGGQFMPLTGQNKLTRGAVDRGIQNITGAFDQGAAGPFKNLLNYASGKGALQAGDETGTFSIAPGGSFELRSKQGFGVTGNPVNKSLGVTIPVGREEGRGTVGLQGSWGLDPSIQANFQFGTKFPSVSSPEQAVNDALGPAQQPELRPGISPRDFLNQKIEEYRSSGGRDPNSPSSWW